MEAATVAMREGAPLEGAPPESSTTAAELVVDRLGWDHSLLIFVNVVFVSVLAIYVGIGYAVYRLIT